ncbi:Mitochondrial intermembrane space cysteine motif-containing protein MIX23 [Wickerhamiella sorbophila]|uniref:Mitochondrial intermembrane space cysteine motif-containing protein MIX23 n=1 Tax=Wickerhamiella sorbophila TaxID=45607 RepID=A0A2T0FD46_9ASCO|nr:Mitochondrial intermembrane space cysteine motif-containing protein MIX23 [Wickerhamiella sorbophila]PRT52928.1 Mitochondrial intermembrane space cysteine motif-containing protein MIX23 [Wickerhamiella sorbophila]
MEHTELQTPYHCVNPSAIKTFLRQSRAISDDKIPSSLTQRSCGEVLPRMYNEWRKRDDILAFCGAVAGGSLDESLPDNTAQIKTLTSHARDHIEFAKTQNDPRVDSYAARDETALKDLERDSTMQWVRREKLTEEIIRETTVRIIADKCGGLGVDAQQFHRY